MIILKKYVKIEYEVKNEGIFSVSSNVKTKIHPLLGRTADITINRKLGGRNIRHKNITYAVNIGYFSLEQSMGENKHTVYIIGASNTSDIFEARIIAIIRHTKTNELLAVAAPVGKSYFEPQIRECLSFFERQYEDESEYQFYFEKSCGAIVFKIENNIQKFLVVRNAWSGRIGFPNERIEFGESEKETAIRKIMENTSLCVDIPYDFRSEYTYSTNTNSRKSEVYFTAEYYNGIPRVRDDEISDIWSLTFEEAIKILDYPQDMMVLTEARDYYENKRKSDGNMW